MTRYIIFLFGLFTLALTSCEVAPQKIEYGSDACSFCDMTIVDPKYSAQLVTKKGKNYKYDAVECMIHALNDDLTDTPMAIKLVANFDNPGEMTDATKAGYLVSEEIKSPMGANLASFENEDKAVSAKEKFGGKVYSWSTIQEHLKL